MTDVFFKCNDPEKKVYFVSDLVPVSADEVLRQLSSELKSLAESGDHTKLVSEGRKILVKVDTILQMRGNGK